MTLYDKIPDRCPECGNCGEPHSNWYRKAENIVRYDDGKYPGMSLVDEFEEEGDPVDQPARAFCRKCLEYLPMSASLVEELFN